MDARTGCSLELLQRLPSKRTRKPPLLFVHGAYVAAWCWDAHFLAYLATQGFASYALSLRGHGASGCDVDYASLGIDDYVDDVARTVAQLDAAPVLIGHSMGALVVTRFLSRLPAGSNRVVGGVLMAPVPLSGLAPVLLDLAFRSPLILAEMHQVQFGQARFNNLAHIRRALFSAGVDDALVRSYFGRMQREAHRALVEMSMLHWAMVASPAQSPLLVLGAANDGFFAPQLITASARGLGAACEIIPDMAHAMMLEPGWQAVADRIAAWAEALDR